MSLYASALPLIVATTLTASSFSLAATELSQLQESAVKHTQQNLQRLSDNSPHLTIEYDSITYSESDEILVINNLVATSKSPYKPFRIVFDNITRDYVHDSSQSNLVSLSKAGFLHINEMHFDVDYLLNALKPVEQGLSVSDIEEASLLFNYYKGDDQFVSSSLNIDYQHSGNDDLAVDLKLGVENVGDLSLQTTLSGAYSFNGQPLDSTFLLKMAMGGVSIDNLTLQAKSVSMAKMVDYLYANKRTGEGSLYHKENSLNQIKDEIDKLKAQDELNLLEQYLLDATQSLYVALSEGKDIYVTLKASNVNFKTILGLMGKNSLEDQEQYIIDTFGFELNFSTQ